MADNVNIGQGVLTESDLTKLNNALTQIDEGIRQVRLAQQAGITPPKTEADFLSQRQQIVGIKQVYFPGR